MSKDISTEFFEYMSDIVIPEDPDAPITCENCRFKADQMSLFFNRIGELEKSSCCVFPLEEFGWSQHDIPESNTCKYFIHIGKLKEVNE